MKRLLIYLLEIQLKTARNLRDKYILEENPIFTRAHMDQVNAYKNAIMFLEAELNK